MTRLLFVLAVIAALIAPAVAPGVASTDMREIVHVR